MPVIWRFILALYNLILFIAAAAAVAISLGETQPLHYINLLAAPENRVACGTVGIIVALLSLTLLYLGLKKGIGEDGILVDKSLLGEVSVSSDAIKLIIMKAVRQIDGVKEIRSRIKRRPDGLSITLEMMVNPEKSIPELSSATQKIVKEYLEGIGGLQIAEIKVKFDDFNASR